MSLPRLMVAPNGARKTKADHPAVPITLPEILNEARACYEAGAEGLHLHLRDDQGGHLLDSGAYREALAELRQHVPDMAVQITTEAVNKYTPIQQRQVALNSGASMVSVSIREMLSDGDMSAARNFYAQCAEREIAVQHILYDAGDFHSLSTLLPQDQFRDPGLQVIYVLGRYRDTQLSELSDMGPFNRFMAEAGLAPDWALCAFGASETECLVKAADLGGKMRVGFENNLQHADGSVACTNADRVHDVLQHLNTAHSI